jgi:branched-chain amino acid transport system permease protein
MKFLWRTLAPRHVFVGLLVLLFPFFATPFFTFQVASQSLILGLIALSLAFLAGYGGMVSLAQMTVAGIAGYGVAVFGTSSAAEISLAWPWWVAVPAAVLVAAGLRHPDRLAVGAHRRHLHHHDHAGHRRGLLLPGAAELQRVQRLPGPARGEAAHRVRRQLAQPHAVLLPVPVLGAGRLLLVHWVVRAPFGIALQGIRDNPRRMAALGYHVVAHSVAAYALSGLVAAVGGILFTWYNGLITPGLGEHRLADQRAGGGRAGRRASTPSAPSSAPSSSCCCRPLPSTSSTASASTS